jgi:HPt (histidine-containing phosphotransfer) domain-containing protein
MAHLARQTLGDPGLEQEVLRLFDDATRAYFRRLESSTTVEELLGHLHTLKGAAAGVGARAIAHQAATAEAELRDGNPVNPERIEDLGMAVAECSAFIEELLGPQDE